MSQDRGKMDHLFAGPSSDAAGPAALPYRSVVQAFALYLMLWGCLSALGDAKVFHVLSTGL